MISYLKYKVNQSWHRFYPKIDVIELGSAVHDQERYGKNPKKTAAEQGEKKNPTEVYREAFGLLITLIARMQPAELQQIKKDLAEMGGTDSLVVLQNDMLALIIQRKSAGSQQ